MIDNIVNLNNIILVFISLSSFAIATKTFKYYGLHINRFLTFNDYVFIVILSLMFVVSQQYNQLIIDIFMRIFLIVFALVLLIDAMAFKLYTMELEPNAVKEFFLDYSEFITESKTQLKFIIFNRLSLLLVIWVWFLLSIFIDENSLIFATTTLLSQSLFIIAKSKFKFDIILLTFLLSYLVYLGVDYLMNNPIVFVKETILLLLIIGLILQKLYKNNNFFKNNSFFHIIGINPITIDKNFKIKKEDEYLLEKPIKKDIKSSNFGLCKNANVLIISIESLGRDFIQHYGGKAKLPIFDKLSAIGLTSNNHYCVSANTNNAFIHLYQEGYIEKKGCLNKLKNYDSWFLTSQNVNSFKLKEAVENAGFQNIIDQQSLKENFNIKQTNPWGMTDDFIYNQEMAQFIDKRDKNNPFFMHILNAQTHVNYCVANKKKYNNFNNNTNYGRYLNAVEESNVMIEAIINKLKDNQLLDNTIIVICGDHGQSFGKNGYKVHSNAIIAEQMLTPFLIWHPKIQNTTIDISSHFDIMPTIFDLLGVEGQSTYGRSLFSDTAFSPLSLYTKTNRGKMPSSFGYVEKNNKIIVDSIYKKVSYVTHQDEIIKNLSPQETKYYLTLANKVFKNQKGF